MFSIMSNLSLSSYSLNSIKIIVSNKNINNIYFPFVHVFPFSLFFVCLFQIHAFYNPSSCIFLKAGFLKLALLCYQCQRESETDFMCLTSYHSIVCSQSDRTCHSTKVFVGLCWGCDSRFPSAEWANNPSHAVDHHCLGAILSIKGFDQILDLITSALRCKTNFIH